MTINEKTLKKITDRIGAENVRINEPMKEHTTMKVGGPAKYFFTPEKAEDVKFLTDMFRSENVPYLILGMGANMIVRDGGLDMAVICMLKLNKIAAENPDCAQAEDAAEVNPDCAQAGGEAEAAKMTDGAEYMLVRAGAGVLNKDFSAWLAEREITGFEFASGIPGSIGGSTSGNAGAYDGEYKNIVKEVTVLDEAGCIRTLSNAEMDFSYRHSRTAEEKLVILEVTFELKKGDRAEIQTKIDDLTAKRAEKQPLEYPSSGSTFKRPTGYFAGPLIQDAGMKGFRLGGAQVSEKHAGFIINRDNATAKDVTDLIELVQKKVLENAGVELHCEVKILG